MANPATEVEVEAGDPISVELGRAAVGAGEQGANLGLQFGGEDFVGVEQKNPVGGAMVEGDVLLLAVATEGMVTGFCAEGLADLDGAVARAGVDEDEFIGPADTLESARRCV